MSSTITKILIKNIKIKYEFKAKILGVKSFNKDRFEMKFSMGFASFSQTNSSNII